MYFIGIDLGTSAVKLLLMQSGGKIIRTVSESYPVNFPQTGWSEQNPEDWFDGTIKGLSRLLEGIDGNEVAGISFGGQMHGLTLLDSEGQVIRPAILWNDGRSQKAIRSLEKDRYGLGFAKDFNKLSKEELMLKLTQPSSERQFIMYEALRKGATVEELYELTKIKHWFIEQMKELVEEEESLLKGAGRIPDEPVLRQAKLDGFSDKYLSQLLSVSEDLIRRARYEYGIKEAWEGVHVSGTQDAAYYYSSYHIAEDKSPSSNNKKIMILGGGPNRIGQGIEFDYCCVHAALALKKLGFEGIRVKVISCCR